MRLVLALASLALLAPGDRATASYSGTTLRLTLQYAMTCGEPGPGPLVVALPAGFRLVSARVVVRGRPELYIARGSTLAIQLPQPPQVTCMSIAEGTLPVVVRGVHAGAGAYTIRARIRSHSFAVRLRIR